MSELLPIGTKTEWGIVAAVGYGSSFGERYYWIVDGNSVAMMPASVVEDINVQENNRDSERAQEP